MKKTFLIIGLLTAALAPIKAQNAAEVPVYLDDKQPLELRVQDALKRMTLEEKPRLSYAQGKFSSPGCPRLGIPELWMSDGLMEFVLKSTGTTGDMPDGQATVVRLFLR